MPSLVHAALGLALVAADPVEQSWPHWRGPFFDGSTVAEGLPVEFSKTEQVAWSAALPGQGAATPIVWDGRVFVTAADAEHEELVALCFDLGSGELLWTKLPGSGYMPANGEGTPTRLDPRSNYASPSPVTDGTRVVFFFGNGDLTAFDLDGEELWSRNLQRDHGDFAFQWTFSASPTLLEGRLFLPVLQRDTAVNGRGGEKNESFLLVLDAETGETLHRQVRPAPAQKESLESYATVIPWRTPSGAVEMLVLGGDVLSGHDPETGAERWRWGTWNPGHREIWWRIVPSPVVGGGAVLVCAPKRAPVYALDLAALAARQDQEQALRWKSGGRPIRVSSDVPTPLFYQGAFYVLSDVEPGLSRVDPATGEVAWTVPLSKDWLWRASPTGADGKVWCLNHHGDVVVVDAGDGAVVHQASLGEEDEDLTRSSIAIAGNRVLVRTRERLYCLSAETTSE